ncbi:hypothetical protein DENIS_3365 [Desulfonema ishimotonii]|uniref:TNase-like domain-containing protein n=1 Tax=Desulfonema ishimotonii TaxID=45657 RepID=A0A401FZN4_9BACT|nr:thermonuclease family protein [Desulfonema ishimotonii]GBC62393.1 hypothetical protein DENIS_3365 [Desulfonema ishimotonii]
MKSIVIYLFSILVAATPLSAFADTLILKNGQRIENVEVWEENGSFRCYRFGAMVGYDRADVMRVELKPVARPEANFAEPETGATEPEPTLSAAAFTVTKISDGDTFRATGHGVEIIVRIAGIDAPETGGKRKKKKAQPYGRKAKDRLEEMIMGKVVRLRGYGTGKYNRQIAEVFADGQNAGLELVRQGLAEVYSGKMSPGFDAAPYRKAEQQARQYRKGIWSLGNLYVSPAKWRKR